MNGAQLRRRLKRRWRENRGWLIRNVLALGIAAVHLVIFSSRMGETLEMRLTDHWFKLRSMRAKPDSVVIISIDELAYKALGHSPLESWPRRRHAELLTRLHESGATRVIFDLFFDTPGADPEGDRKLEKALSLLPTYIGSYQFLVSTGDGLETRSLAIAAPLEIFARAARRVTLMNFKTHGAVRHFPIFDQTIDKGKTLVSTLVEEQGVPGPKPGDLIDYYGPGGYLSTIPFVTALSAEIAWLKERVQGKTVVIGTLVQAGTGLAAKDAHLTPISSAPMPGVEIHATTIANILEQKWIHRLDPAVELTLTNVAAFLVSLVLLRFKPLRGLVFLGLYLILWVGASYAAFLNGYFVPGLTLAVLILPATFGFSTLAYYLGLQRSHRKIEEALGIDLPG